MLHQLSCGEVVTQFQRLYKILAPDVDSVAIARDLWLEWEKTGNTPPNINEIAKDYAQHENGFFYELVRLAEKMHQGNLPIQYCQFTLDRYNAYAITTKDCYIVLIDDVFFQLLYFICNILVFDAAGGIEDPAEKEQAKKFIAEIMQVNYFSRKRIDFSEEGIQHVLLKRDYELAEFANYFFHACKAFIIAHEIGHHVLGHARGTTKRVFALHTKEVTVEVDERAIADEYEADHYGYKLFGVLSNTNDDTVYYAWCKFKFNFAPAFLFDLFNAFDRLQEKRANKVIEYTGHPHPVSRQQALQEQFSIEMNDPLYLSLKESLAFYLGA
ncbi:hypothetical protein D3H65_01600 [Paraflavitalea soli]|uniref:Uncharacterized protein n=1 Tax=Paraflavitalea soli TaxID=2315862 RepID=A0A3B7MHF3_9BACT|nr:hypothetical protein [Paraflavitalea soli]AXY72743.1 hypothetical protein D3H65_01600 [Paraflavitalea soli]